MSEGDRMASAIAAARAAMEADGVIHRMPAGTPGRRDRMREIIHAAAATWGVERMELTMALASLSHRDGAG